MSANVPVWVKIRSFHEEWHQFEALTLQQARDEAAEKYGCENILDITYEKPYEISDECQTYERDYRNED